MPYGDGGVMALKEAKDSQKFDPQLNDKGFLHQYANSDMENDFNSFAENLFYPASEFYNIVGEYEKLNQKLEIIIEFYHSIDKTFTKGYFDGFKK